MKKIREQRLYLGEDTQSNIIAVDHMISECVHFELCNDVMLQYIAEVGSITLYFNKLGHNNIIAVLLDRDMLQSHCQQYFNATLHHVSVT